MNNDLIKCWNNSKDVNKITKQGINNKDLVAIVSLLFAKVIDSNKKVNDKKYLVILWSHTCI